MLDLQALWCCQSDETTTLHQMWKSELLKPFPFQSECLDEIDAFSGRSLIAMPMGSGKTPLTLWWLKRNPQSLPAVVICPASVKYHWQHQALVVLGFRSSVLESRNPSRNGEGLTRSELMIINYDILQYWEEWIRKQKPKTIVIDECQFTQSSKSIRTKTVKRLCRGVPNVLALSGTPLVNRPIELFPTLSILRPKEFRNRWTFGHEFCGPKWTPWGIQFKGANNSKRLHELLASTCMIRRKKEDILKDLPPKMRHVIPVPLRDPKEYQKASEDFLNWLKEKDPAKAVRASKAQTLVKMGYMLRLAARLKLKYVVEWINQFLHDSDEKLVVFAVHRKMIEALQRRCSGRSVVVDGSVTGRKRRQAIRQFQNDKRTRLLIGNIKAVGTGTDGLQRVCSTAVFAELTWTPGAHVQAEDRIHRIGTTDKARIFYLVAHSTIEEKLCQIIQDKQEVLSAVLDGEGEGESLSVFDELILQLGKENEE